jgi:hypothetical protein
MNEFDIKLEKAGYIASEEAKGSLIISTDSHWKLKNFKFCVQGEENSWKTTSSYDGQTSTTHREQVSDTFFFEDLSAIFWESLKIKPSYEGEFELEKGQWNIPFQFTIPASALESYHGIDATISYKVTASAHEGIFHLQRGHFHCEKPFNVTNPNYDADINGLFFLGNRRNIFSDFSLDSQENEKDGFKVRLEIEGDKTSFSPGV